jgi:hypothetical protein
MGNNAVSYQSPRPEVVIYRPDKKGKPLHFDTANRTQLQSYSFGTSINDEKGRFSLTFYPDEDILPYKFEPIFDRIHPMDIVEIYETRNHFKQGQSHDQYKEPDTIFPTFVGVIREKKYAAQKTENGVTRKIVASGISVAGLVHELKVNFDMQATVITAELKNNAEIQQKFTIKFIQKNNSPLDVSYVIKEIWKSFVDLNCQHGKTSNPKVGEYIKNWIGDENDIFSIDDSVFHYPIGSVFKGQTTQTFFDVIANLVPKPVYEIFPFMDRESGIMKIMIRECPFDKEAWQKIDCCEIDPKMVKSFDLTQNDNEVYTVFFSYLSGYPIQEDKVIVLATQGIGDMPGVEIDEDKFKVYGYRPLFVSFNGYGKADGENDTKTTDRLQKLNARLKNWYGNKEKMFSGNITMETDLAATIPQAGEKIVFLGGEFYIVDSEHNWSYGGSPETKLTLARGGDYTSGQFSELLDTAGRYREFKELQSGG